MAQAVPPSGPMVLISDGIDPLLSVALDETLLGMEHHAPMVHLYRRNRPTVSLGYSRPLSDIDRTYCREHGISVVRRISGGGTVYSSSGQWQLALLRSDKDRLRPRVDSLLATHLEALRSALAGELGPMGGRLEVVLPNDLYLDEGKVAGGALRLSRTCQLFHATIVDSLMDDQLGKVLRSADPPRRMGSIAASRGHPLGKEGVQRVAIALLQHHGAQPPIAVTDTPPRAWVDAAQRLVEERIGTERWLEGSSARR